MAEPATSSSPRWRRPLGAAIVLFWLLMMGLLARRELGGRKVSASLGEEGPRRPSAQTLFLGLELATGERVGVFQIGQVAERRFEVEGLRTSLLARLSLDLLGKRTSLRLQGNLWQGGELTELDARARSNDTDFRVRGRLEKGKLEATLETGGETLPISIPFGRELFLDSGLGAALRLPSCEEGEVLRFDSFDPLTLSKSSARLECLEEETLLLAGEETRTRKLKVFSGGFESLAWVDAQGNVLRAETPFGFVLEKISRQEALEPLDSAPSTEDGPGWLGLTAVKPTGKKPFRGAKRLLLRVSGGPLPPQDAAQRLRADGLFEVFAGPTPGEVEEKPADLAPFLRAEPLLQSDHPKMIAAARQIVGTENDPAKQARVLHEWVFVRLDKEPVLSLPSALEVLERRRGDCNEHAVLYTALARSLGLPSRVAVGLVWSDEQEGFFYHAWPEVLLAGSWQRFDPTLDQPVADATHLKLLAGGIESWPQLLPFLGRLQIEVVAVE